MTLLLLLAACSTEPANAPATPAATPPPPAAVAAPPAVADHEHTAPPHGGEMRTVGPIHVEAKFVDAGVMVWILDHEMKPVEPVPYVGTATVQGPSRTQTVPLAVMGDHLHASAPLQAGKPATAVLSLPVEGQMRSLSFSTTAIGKLEAHDHATLHGGVVSMWGEVHVEYAPQGDEYRFYISDADRVKATIGVTGTVTDGDRTIPLAFDPELGVLHAKGEGVGTRPVLIAATVGPKSFELGFAPVSAAAGDDHAEGGHAH